MLKTYFPQRADVAQLAEQLICNQQVAGSSPIVGSIFLLFLCGFRGFPGTCFLLREQRRKQIGAFAVGQQAPTATAMPEDD